jgi:hypothetical protein
MRTRFSPVAVIALVLALSSALPAQAAPRFSAEPQRLVSRLVTILAKMPGRLVSFWEKEGAGVDPFGKPGAMTPPKDPSEAEATASSIGAVDRR